MRPYLAVLSARFRMLLQYRASAIAGFATQLFWGLIRVMIFTAFFVGVSHEQPMTLAAVISYLWLTQATLAMFPWNVDSEIMMMVRQGTVAYELVRPIDLYWLWFWRALASRTAPMVLRALPMFVLAWACFGLQPPADAAAGLAWLTAMVGALALSAALSTLMNIFLLFTISGDGLNRLMPGVAMICSGLIVPLPFFPESWQVVLGLLPFRGLVDAPFRLYIGHLPASGLGFVLAHQFVWVLVLVLLGKSLLALAARRMVVQGG